MCKPLLLQLNANLHEVANGKQWLSINRKKGSHKDDNRIINTPILVNTPILESNKNKHVNRCREHCNSHSRIPGEIPGQSTFKEKRSQVHAVKSADNTESKLHKQQLMTCLNSPCVGFNMEENCTNQLLCSVEWEWSASAQRKGQTCCSMRAWRRAHIARLQ